MRCHAHLQRKFRNNLDHMIQPPQWHIARQWVSQTLPSVPRGHDHTDLRFHTASVDSGLSRSLDDIGVGPSIRSRFDAHTENPSQIRRALAPSDVDLLEHM
jgi:hypothetical protein